MVARQSKSLSLVLGMLSGALVAGFAIGLFEKTFAGLISPAAAGIGATGLMLAACAGAIPLWRRLDEVAREAQQSAWYWGGSIGSCFALGLAVYAVRAPVGALPAAMNALSVNAAFGLGVLACVALQILAFLIGWAIWWASKR
jgi:hypothetical protein